jgi:hypothetical protein
MNNFLTSSTASRLRALIVRLQPILPSLAAACAFLILVWLYWSNRTAVHTFDAVSYMWNIEAKPMLALFHPHHLLYAPVGQIAFRMAQTFGYIGHSDAPVQAVNALAGALGVIFLWRFGMVWTGRSLVSLAAAVMVGVCYAYWLYTAEVEVYTLAACFLSLSLWLMARLEHSPTSQRAAAVGLAHAGAIMFHQTNAFFALPVLIFLLAHPRLRRWNIIGAYVITGGLAALIPYALVIFFSGMSDPAVIFDWLRGYAGTGRWGGHLRLEDFSALWTGITRTVGGGEAATAGFYGLAILGLLVGFWWAWRDASRRAWLAFSLTWLIVYGAFFWWWEPFNIEFWIALLPLMALFVMSGLPLETDPPLRFERLWSGGITLAALIVALLLYRGNLSPVQAAGDPANDYYYLVTTALQTELAPGDLVILRGNILDVYIPFYAQHSAFLSLREAEYTTGNDRAAVMAEIFRRMDEAQVKGKMVWIDQILIDEPRSADRNPFGLLPAEIGTIKARYSIQPGIAWNGSNVWYRIAP